MTPLVFADHEKENKLRNDRPLPGCKLRDLAGLAQHLVYLANVLLFFRNQLTGVFFQQHGTVAHQHEQLFVKRQSGFLGFERLQ